MRIVYLDTETTDLMPGQICQLSMIIEENGELEGKNYFFTVDEMGEGAENVHGFSLGYLREVSKGKRFTDCIDEIDSILNGSIIVAHNIAFDYRFLSTEYWRAGRELSVNCKVDTMENFKNIVKITSKGKRGGYKNPKLSEVIEYFDLDEEKIGNYAKEKLFKWDKVGDYHNAIFDTTAMMIAVFCQREEAVENKYWQNAFKKH